MSDSPDHAVPTASATPSYAALDRWIDEHFDEQVRFLQELVRVPTDTPPGNNAPHAERTAELLAAMGLVAEKHAVPAEAVRAAGLESITNLIVRRRYAEGGPVIALNAHGDVVPPGEGWTHGPYSGDVADGKLYGRAAAVSKCDFSTFTYAVRAVEALAQSMSPSSQNPLKGGVELHFTYDEEFGGELGPGWLLDHGLTKPDFEIAAGFSYQVVTAHNGCLQMEVTVHGVMAHAAIPDSGVDALQGATAVLNALYAQNVLYKQVRSSVKGITHPYLNVGLIQGGTNTNVIPGKVVIKLDRRMIPEENPHEVEATLHAVIRAAAATVPGVTVDIKRMLMAHALKPLAGNRPLVEALQRHGEEVFGEPIPESGTPLYTDVRLYCERGIPAVIYGAGPRTVRESNAKRADEHIVLDDLRRATKVVARTLLDLLR
ncbi:M20/M25/M40 family metallo-hydrolase [Sphaerotilus mobilis]|uniref:Acetylornithine deacetylase/succinyl-diaminopimelate desuccinylase-like protein n=1 Tax=Sphaerotilus mobilis TaxID=47994 RepID=A0A4Q7LDP1_9BURK|nr:M20/M25/M40 family metallo-hydrolase [Sphaerotilus mobilis]RZS52112.1 acetylornithine deacetylase/succinyl-diaminopimelate desuccinylase-like protein [Sphaerotilus mobilis]